jgi:hypothetical protein
LEEKIMSESVPLAAYETQLADFLSALRQHIASASAAVACTQLEDWEQYLLELNLYYYQSFAQEFLPPYQEQLLQQIKQVHQLHLDESNLKQYVLQLLRAYAGLNNQLLAAAGYLEQTIASLAQLQEAQRQYEQSQTIRLYQQMIRLTAECRALQALFNRTYNYAQNPEVRFALKQFPGHASLLTVLTQPDIEAKPNLRFLQVITENIRTHLTILQQPESSTEKKSGLLQQAVMDDLDKKILSALKNWYTRYYDLQQKLYLTAADEKNLSLAKNSAAEYKAWLNALLIILQAFYAAAFKQPAAYVPSPQELDEQQQENEKQVQELQHWAAQTKPDAVAFSQIVEQTQPLIDRLKQTALHYQAACAEWNPGLTEAYRAILAGIEVAEIIQEEYVHFSASYPVQTMQQALHTAEAQLQEDRLTLQQLQKTVLGKNFSQQFQQLNIKLEHHPVKAGWPLSPAAYEAVRAYQPEALPRSPHILVHKAYGDIFLFGMDALTEAVIPVMEFLPEE